MMCVNTNIPQSTRGSRSKKSQCKLKIEFQNTFNKPNNITCLFTTNVLRTLHLPVAGQSHPI